LNSIRLLLVALLAIAIAGCSEAPQRPPPAATSLRLYTIDCGELRYADFSSMSDRGDYAGRSGFLKVSCYLIQHPTEGWMIWDTGLMDFLTWLPWGYSEDGIHMSLDRQLKDTLADFGVTPRDIRYVGFSHLHFDHSGNAHEFPKATWIVSSKEVDWALRSGEKEGIYQPSLKMINSVKRVEAVDGLDVFGDGSVKLISTPGHTPGHFSLLVNLENSGPQILVGDLYHLEESREKRAIPIYNTDREQTLKSMDLIEALAKKLNARIVIGHDPVQFAAMPVFPKYLD